ncbi:MAG: type IV-A pilus assembly ATPase PilB, partial [Proteobacteria bacterium]|nr:type IV-A pilus assembly ATPase PilB [Pseudomonadota bacterium]
MNAVTTANLVGITGIARRLVMDGAMDESTAREALAGATAERKPIATFLTEKRLVAPSAMAAANSIEFGVPLLDASAIDPAQSAINLVKEELLRKHCVLPMFKRGNRLFVGLADPTNTRALDEIKFQTNLTIEAILVDEDSIRRSLDRWLESSDSLSHGEDEEGMENLEVGSDDELAAGPDTGIDAKGDDTPVVKFINKILVDAI